MSDRKKHSASATVVLTDRALSDLREIERYSVDAWGRRAADKYLDEIAAALDRLAENPGILGLEPAFATDLHFYRVKRHLLVCHCRESAVFVLTVVHTSMDVPSRLAELEPRLVAEVDLLTRRIADL